MATLPPVANEVRKMTFAKVAAGPTSKDSASITAIARNPISAVSKDRRDIHQTVPIAAVTIVTETPSAAGAALGTQRPATSGKENKGGLGSKDLKLETKTPNLIVNGSSTERSGKASTNQTPSDDNSRGADSGSDLGTKPPSLDGKSITSGTTFALDEKESLRPDDSASVKAAAEDDDAFSFRGSYIASSRVGSDIAARCQRIQIGDMPLRPIPTTHTMAGHGPGISTPQSGGSEKQPVTESKIPLVGGPAAPDSIAANGYLSQNPDEKLLEAMQSPKDRLFLLRLEQQVIEFVQDSKEPFMDLPPSNSFCRMLTHKLADYYHMTHSFEAVAGAVRIYRTPFCRIPPSLSSIAVNTSASSSPAPAVMPRKIMRRGEEGEFTASASPSKPTSEVGSDSKEKGAVPKEKLTREEREEAYNKARQRIFGSVESNDNSNQGGDDSNGVSRASSVSTKDRSNVGKRKTNKQRRDDSESFESRSQFLPWPGPQQLTWAPAGPQFFPANGASYNGQFQQPYPTGMQPSYGPNQAYPQMVPSNGYAPQYNGMTTYPTPPVPQPAPQQPRYQPPNPPIPAPYAGPMPNALPQGPAAMPQPSIPQSIPQSMPQNMPQASIPQPAWSQPPQLFNQNAYPPSRASPSPAGIPYAYGQLPANANPNDPKSQHPIPGSYSRQAFNPKSQTFVPGNGIGPMQPPPNVYGGSSPHHGSPQFNSPHMNYSAFQQPLPQPVFVPGPGAYGMARQGSNNSMTQYHPVQPPPMGPPHGQHMPSNASPHIPNKSLGPPGAVQTFSHLPNYGNPASLPQKPT